MQDTNKISPSSKKLFKLEKKSVENEVKNVVEINVN